MTARHHRPTATARTANKWPRVSFCSTVTARQQTAPAPQHFRQYEFTEQLHPTNNRKPIEIKKKRRFWRVRVGVWGYLLDPFQPKSSGCLLYIYIDCTCKTESAWKQYLKIECVGHPSRMSFFHALITSLPRRGDQTGFVVRSVPTPNRGWFSGLGRKNFEKIWKMRGWRWR